MTNDGEIGNRIRLKTTLAGVRKRIRTVKNSMFFAKSRSMQQAKRQQLQELEHDEATLLRQLGETK